MTLIFQILAVILAGIAAYFLWNDNFDWAFAFVAFAVCSFFIGMRFQIKARMAAREAAAMAEPVEDED
ncbi:MAG: hypothetical protein QM785_08360 [Pyrinomonadaceae bacterium]